MNLPTKFSFIQRLLWRGHLGSISSWKLYMWIFMGVWSQTWAPGSTSVAGKRRSGRWSEEVLFFLFPRIHSTWWRRSNSHKQNDLLPRFSCHCSYRKFKAVCRTFVTALLLADCPRVAVTMSLVPYKTPASAHIQFAYLNELLKSQATYLRTQVSGNSFQCI